MTTLIRRTLAATAFAAALLVPQASASAQATGPRWAAWLGCWTPALTGQTLLEAKVAPVICALPTSNTNAVELVTLGDTKVLSRDTIDASGVQHTTTTKNCTGAQVAQWSADERRVYLHSTSTCDGLRSTTSAILAMSPAGEWLDVRGVNAGDGSNVRVAVYRAVDIPTQKLDSILGSNAFRTSPPARIAAGANIGTSAISEALKNVDGAVVESWILERGQRFSVDAKTLVALADAGIPGNITDAMIAVSNPDQFHLGRADVVDAAHGYSDDDVRGRRVYAGTMSYCDPYSRNYDPYACRYSYDPYYGYGRYGYGYGYGSGYGYGYGYNGGYYGPAVVVITPSTGAGEARGQAVKGRGYTQTGGTATSAARDRNPPPSTSTSSSNGNSSTSSASPSTSNTNSSNTSSGDRTAKSRP